MSYPSLLPFSRPPVSGLFFAAVSAVHTGNAGDGEEGWGNPLYSHWCLCERPCAARHTQPTTSDLIM